MSDPQGTMLPVGEPARFAVAKVLRVAEVNAVAFTVFAVVTTQIQAVRAGSPWQDDPYDVVVSFTKFFVPALTALVWVRARLCDVSTPVPLSRLAQTAPRRRCLHGAHRLHGRSRLARPNARRRPTFVELRHAPMPLAGSPPPSAC